MEVAHAFSLAECLSEEMIERGWTTEDVVCPPICKPDAIRPLIFAASIFSCACRTDNLLIDPITFDGLTRAFGVDPDFFRNMDAAWRRAPKEVRAAIVDPPEQIFGPISRCALMRQRSNAEIRKKRVTMTKPTTAESLKRRERPCEKRSAILA